MVPPTFRDAKNTLDLTTYEDTNFQIHMNFHTDTKDN